MITELLVNGSRKRVDVDPGKSLLFVLRDDLDLTGAKYGCGEGQCGACTVLINGLPRRSCQTTVSQAAGKPISTIESLEKNGKLHPVQQAFLDTGSMQCGFCTTGMIMSAVGILNKYPNPTDEQIIQFMNGNVCRCGTYNRIFQAIKQAAKSTSGGDAK